MPFRSQNLRLKETSPAQKGEVSWYKSRMFVKPNKTKAKVEFEGEN